MSNKAAMILTALLVLTTLKSKLEAKIIHDEIAVCKNTDAILPCDGAPHARHSWKIKTGNSSKRKIPDNLGKYAFINNSLLIKNVEKMDTKNRFYCQTSSVDHFRITYFYSVKINCDEIHSFVGGIVILPCDVDIQDDDIGKVTWKYRSKQGNLRKLASGKSRKLTIRNVKLTDSGTYICVVQRVKNISLSKGIFSYQLHVDKATVTKTPFPIDTTTIEKPPNTEPITTTTLPSSGSHTTTRTNFTATTNQPQIANQTSTKSSIVEPKSVNTISTKTPTKAMSTIALKITRSTKKTTETVTSSMPLTSTTRTLRSKSTEVLMHSTLEKTNPERPTLQTSTARKQEDNVDSESVKTNVYAFDNKNQKVVVKPTTKPQNSSGTILTSMYLSIRCYAVLMLVFINVF